ncbi:NAD(P)H-binding protein [Mucilaginibacter rubeus]|uniref:NAD(P)H-binding protein n=1 Tax=Mucilaginibacter rubeus TaxID=2027860 RepID=A0AAE6MIW1_9SPHI|nr:MULTISPECIES: NAD(P)H-binding protein [Mucilaginibacter]QEM04624.1 NAD(P)H-binding protein [Mucilaginibacter rubeus]QEM17217.1 NAD(P)H-binding protein [Mucilaginibacter gossypii]QTE46277.1 NmrA family NAD(P)-binding protein [Mucilaginibacter rubeus]QTE52874.1 NmrA family NAD(P)-binding protein [Mucilaginibacter rubeus]QTE57960.1 NmrA family NAD(P)-binding protein [Mucilaginibacter rubeus]
MKIIVTGSTGNISKPLTQTLIVAGHNVTVISSNADKVAEIESLGAKAAIGSLADADFLTQTFTGADALYAMVPPSFSAESLRAYQNETGKSYAEAIKRSGIKKVVALSSIGAHLDSGVGPIKGIHDVEGVLSGLDGVAVKFIRAPFFYINFFSNIPLIKHQGILGSNYPADARLIMVHPKDIAAAIAEELQKDFTGKSIRYIVSEESTPGKAAAILGEAIGNPNLPWIEFTDEQLAEGLSQAGVPPEMTRNFVEMGTAVKSGKIWEDYDKHRPVSSGKVSLQDFAREFAAVYNG